jgi:hypothetical protein
MMAWRACYTYLSWVVLQRLPLAVQRSCRWGYGCRWLVSSITRPVRVRVFTVLSSRGQGIEEFHSEGMEVWSSEWATETALYGVLRGVLYRRTREIYSSR